jgi:hypothetical protein
MRKPPYFYLLAEQTAVGNRNSFWLLIGADSWEWAKQFSHESHRLFTLCPPDADPRQYDWSIYRAAPPPVALRRCGKVDGEQCQSAIRCLLKSGSPRVYDMRADAVYEPARQEAAA